MNMYVEYDGVRYMIIAGENLFGSVFEEIGFIKWKSIKYVSVSVFLVLRAEKLR